MPVSFDNRSRTCYDFVGDYYGNGKETIPHQEGFCPE